MSLWSRGSPWKGPRWPSCQRSSPVTRVGSMAMTQRPNRTLCSGRACCLQDWRRCIMFVFFFFFSICGVVFCEFLPQGRLKEDVQLKMTWTVVRFWLQSYHAVLLNVHQQKTGCVLWLMHQLWMFSVELKGIPMHVWYMMLQAYSMLWKVMQRGPGQESVCHELGVRLFSTSMGSLVFTISWDRRLINYFWWFFFQFSAWLTFLVHTDAFAHFFCCVLLFQFSADGRVLWETLIGYNWCSDKVLWGPGSILAR